MMLRSTVGTLWLVVLACSCSIIAAASGGSSHRAIPTSWVAPSCSSRYGALSSRRSPSVRAPQTSLSAVQDRILDGLRLKWQNNDDSEAESQTDAPTNTNGNANGNGGGKVPFVIQRIGRGTKREIEEITKMCIDVFFNEQEDLRLTSLEQGETGKKQVTPWKALQLAYLRNMQEGGIMAQNACAKDKEADLVIARRVYPVEGAINGNRANLIEDNSQIYNMEQFSDNGDEGMYVTGEIIGYCECSEKNFGLGGRQGRPLVDGEEPRPYLSNLSVVEYARQSGVGSRLLDATEDAVREWKEGSFSDMVLQVEEDNTDAIQFYKRRGWEFVFADPTCRRYDTSGFILKETRVTKYAMVKNLDSDTDGGNGDEGTNGSGAAGPSLMEKLKKSFFVQ